MRLLNVNDLRLREFKEKELPPYAIASHRWQNGEATYRDIQKERFRGPGYKKVKRFCKLAKRMNDLRQKTGSGDPTIEWIWIDTCCINHESSQDVQENINSMYKYYERAMECYAYLFDVCDANSNEQLLRSSWFQRGWTLQELLAPTTVIFMDASWKNIIGHKCNNECRGTRCQQIGRSLNTSISLSTGISPNVMSKKISVLAMDSETISRWAYLRQTERVEDLAYCLLGLLGVFMETIYGEGANAWTRLERELSSKRGRASRLVKPKQLENLERGEWDRIWNNRRPPGDNDGGGGGGRGGGGGGLPPPGGGGRGPGGPGGPEGNADDNDDGDSSDDEQGGEGGPARQRQGDRPGQTPRYNGPRARLAGDASDLRLRTSPMTSYNPTPGSYSMPSRSHTTTGYQMSPYNQPVVPSLSERSNSNPLASVSSPPAIASPFTPQMTRAAMEMAARSGMSREDAIRQLVSQYRQMSLAGPSQAPPSQAGPSRPSQGASSSQASRTIQVGLNRLHPTSAEEEREMQWSSRQMGRTMQQPNARARVTAASAEDSDYDMDDDSDEDSDGGNAAFA